MDDVWEKYLDVMENAFRRMEQGITPPIRVPVKSAFVFRYSEESVEQALIQKLARLLSGLRASALLIEHGYLQEQGALFVSVRPRPS